MNVPPGATRATLRKASEALRQQEEERRERYVAEVTALGYGERDIALAAYDGEAAGDAIVALAEALHGTNVATITAFLSSEAQTLEDYRGDRGSNVHLVALIALRSRLLALASSDDERGTARNNLGLALATLGERVSGTARLDEAVAAYRAALEEWTRERVPLQWAATQNNLGGALQSIGERESGAARLDEAVATFRAALQERTRERVPLQWARTQNNLGNALQSLGARVSGTARLDEAVAAFRAALHERTRERVPLQWAASFGNQGHTLMLIADRNNDGAVAETAVQQIEAAYEVLRSAGQEQGSAYFSEQLAKAKAIRDRFKGR